MTYIFKDDLKKSGDYIGAVFISYSILLIILNIVSLKLAEDNLMLMISVLTYVMMITLFGVSFFKKNKNEKIKPLYSINFIDSIVLTIILFLMYLVVPIFLEYIIGFDKLVNDSYEVAKMENLLVAGIMAPIVEEMVFRGIILKYLKKYGSAFAIFSSSILFALAHPPISFIPALVLGLLTGFLYVATGKIAFPILFHMMPNLGVQIVTEPTAIIIILSIMLIISFFSSKNVKIILKENFKSIKKYILNEKQKLSAFFLKTDMVVFFVFNTINLFVQVFNFIKRG